MRTRRPNHLLAAGVLAVCLAAASAFIWKEYIASPPLGVKSDRLDMMPQGSCTQDVWPYGCDWQFGASPEKKRPKTIHKKHSPFSVGTAPSRDRYLATLRRIQILA